MKVRGWHVERFGRFKNYSISDLPDGITVVYGPNEAGKSTLHAFLRGVLFGFPTGRSTERRLTHEGTAVGHLVIETSGDRYVVERRNAPKQPVVVHRSDGSIGDEKFLHGLLGNADSALFRTVFAFSLRELQDFGSLNEEQVRDRMFSATLGTGRVTPTRAAETLEARAKDLYRDRGATKAQSQVAALLDQIAEIERGIAAARTAAREFPRIEEEIVRINVDLAARRERERALLEERRLRQSLIGLMPLTDDCAALRRELTALPTVERFPADAERRFTELREAWRHAESGASEVEEERIRLTADVERLILDVRLLEAGPSLQLVLGDHPLQRDRLERIEAGQIELALAGQALAAQLERLGPEWTEARVATWSRSTARRAAVEEWQVRLERATAQAGDAARSLSSSNEALGERELELARLRAELPEPEPASREDIERRDADLHRLRGARENERERQQELRECETRLAEAERRIAPSSSSASLLLIGAAAAVIIGSILALVGFAAPALIPLGVAVVLVLVAMRRQPPAAASDPTIMSLRKRRDEATAALEQARRDLVQAAAAFGTNTTPSADELSQLGSSLAREREVRAVYDGRLQQLRSAEVATERLRERANNAAADHDAAIAAIGASRAAWQEVAVSIGLTGTPTPAAALSLLDVLDTARDQLDRCTAQREVLQRESQLAATWSSRAREVLTSLELPAAGDDRALLNAMSSLATVLAEQRELERRRAEKEALLAAAELRFALAVRRRDEAAAALRALYEEGECTGEAEFIGRMESVRRREELEVRLADADHQVMAVLRTLPDAQLARDELTRGSIAGWQARLDTIEEELTVGGAERDDLVERRTGMMQRRDELCIADDVAALDLGRSSVVARIEGAAHEWFALRLASTMIRRTKDVYEREKQPAVIAQATPLFHTITRGRYERILQREDGSGLDLLEATGPRWRESDLSQGTQEQLYLSLRIALAQEFARDRKALPLIMDDVLVNFDPDRADAVAHVLAEVARSRQVVLFTCHPRTCEMLQGGTCDTHVVTLPS